MTSHPSPEALRAFLRAHGAGYLADPNVTSVGIGHKVVDGIVTDEVSIQFTVRRKLAPEELEMAGTEPLPERITVGSFDIATDVLEREFAPAYLVVAEADADSRTTRVDPVMPGVSVAHPSVSAGTLGLIVYDKDNGTPYALSNWHVLQGDVGKLGDTVVQPGPHDDNRVTHNSLGTLVRSHLGAAGDCAVATIEGRGVNPSVMELGVTPQEIGDAELGDKVIKSSRTTGVTHGIVTRVDVQSRIDYGLAGEHVIGGIEIGPDPGKAAANQQISMGGDSGAAWLFRAGNGRTSTVFAGLHFAGEAAGSGERDHALACLPRSVFERLGVTLSPEVAQAAAERSRGYNPGFLAHAVALPTPAEDVVGDAVQVDGSPVVDYTHFSLSMSASRRLALWVAWNVDGTTMKKLSRSKMKFRLDPRVPEDAQVGNELYADNRIDRGHLARRADLTWGSAAEAQAANSDSFYFTNIAPQVDDFNQSSRDGIWGQIEDAVYEQVEVQDLRISVFGGLVFGENDPNYRGVALPREYWKVVVYVEDDTLKARAFLLTQSLDRLEALDLDEFRTYQVSLAELTARTSIRFDPALDDAQDLDDVRESLNTPLEHITDIRW